MVRHVTRNRQPSPRLLAAFGAGIFCACLLGTLLRQGAPLAALWPANAVLLGWLLRQRRLAGPAGWAVATVAFLAADRLSGASLEASLHLTAAHLASVACGYLFLRRNRRFNRLLLGPESVATLLKACLLAAATSAVIALPAMIFMVDEQPVVAFIHGLAAEWANLVIVLPAVLLAYLPGQDGPAADRPVTNPPLQRALPLVCLTTSLWLAMGIGGPLSPALVLPALLWCALTYRPGTVMQLSLLCSLWALMTPAHYASHDMTSWDAPWLDVSIRLGVAAMAIAPLLLIAMKASQRRLEEALHHAAHHDALTGLPSRVGFLDRAESYLETTSDEHSPCALMLDVDHFKRINDRHGLTLGDKVLREVSERLRRELPASALLGRLGGAEFALLLRDCTPDEATALAEQLRLRVDQSPFALQPGLPPLAVSITIGVAQLGEEDSQHLDTLLLRADKALRRAKSTRRNQVVFQD